MKQTNNLDEFKSSLEVKTKKELEKIEQEIIKEAEKVDKELGEAKIELPTKNYENVAEAIRYFLDKQTIQWQYAQAMISMYEFWNPKVFVKNIPYPMLHQTLTNLGSLQFKGYDEWTKVVSINEYFEPLREEYIKLASKPYDVANRHELVMNALGLNSPIEVK